MIVADRFKGQVAVVTGGAEGIGKAIARRIAAEGGKVVLFDKNTEQQERTQVEFSKEGLRVMSVKVDVSHEESVKAGIERVMNAGKRLDVMVNCAGIVGPNNLKITEYESKDFDHVLKINLRGSYLMCKYAIEPMLKAGYGRMLLLASMAGKEGNPGMMGYTASKAGVIGIVKALGKEYAESGVLVNGLAPAVIGTSLIDDVTPEQLKYMTDKIPMKRIGTVEETAALGAWIVSKECTFTTGFTFDLSGGRATY